MNASRLFLADDLPMPRKARHLYLVAVDGKVIDANQHRKESYRDVNELITTVREYNAGQVIQTSYVYDPLKQITLVTDDHGNQTRVRYDNLGRRTNNRGRTTVFSAKHFARPFEKPGI